MNFKNRGIRGALVAVVVALASSAVPAVGGAPTPLGPEQGHPQGDPLT